jgi:hypothetical protein
VETLVSVALFVQKYWREAGWVVAVVLFLLWHSSYSSLSKCKAELETQRSVPAPIVDSKMATTSQSSQRVTITQQPGHPCPDVTVDNKTLALVDAALKAPLPAQKPKEKPFWGLELSSSSPIQDFPNFSVGGSLIAGPFRFGAEYGFQTGTRVQIGARIMFKDFSF